MLTGKNYKQDTLLNPFGETDYVTKKDLNTTWLSQCCGREAYFEPDIDKFGVTGRCSKCFDLVGFISEEEFTL